MSLGRLFTLVRFLPSEGAFFSAVRAQMAVEDEERAKARRRPATLQEIAAMFGMPVG